MHRNSLFLTILFISLTGFSFTILSVVRPEPFLKKSNKITYAITSENGSKSYSEITIQSVTENKGQTLILARDQRLNEEHNTTFSYRMSYYSDTVNWCADALNYLNAREIYSSNLMVELTSDSLVYPLNMKVGDTLPGASASEIMRGTYSNERHIRFQNRKVTVVENVACGGETVPAFRIECTMTYQTVSDYGALGKIPITSESTLTEWFVPAKGVVKSEIKSKTGVTTTLLEGTK
jgi:hypothetical protein